MTTSEIETEPGTSEIRDGMRIDWDVPIEVDDGLVLRADVFRPIDEAPVPALLSYGPYGKGLRFSEHHVEQWEKLIAAHPEVAQGTTGNHITWETADPEKWVPHGYALVRVDSRGAGRSPGVIEPHSPREVRDIACCIEWAGTRPWSTGKVGMIGISYFATNQWLVASLDSPPAHLAAICPWEGAADQYRDISRHGGIFTTWTENWWNARILPIQHGLGERGLTSSNTGELVSGPETLTDAELAANRSDFVGDRRRHPFADAWARDRSAVWENVVVPFLSAGNWGGQALHLRGNVEAFVRAASTQKWLEIHDLEHWTHFYTDYGLDLQRRFFDHTLKSQSDGWADQPRVLLNIRRPGEPNELRGASAWPLPDTMWARVYLQPDGMQLVEAVPAEDAQVSFDALGDGIRFSSPPVTFDHEITGPISAKLHISSSTTDADLFLVLHLIDPDGNEVTWQGSMDPRTCAGKGWLRASHRKLDAELSTPHRPYHVHDVAEALSPGAIYELDIEIWPTCIVVPEGYRIALSILGTDFFHPTAEEEFDSFGQRGVRNGSGAMVHDDETDRPADVFGGVTTIHVGPEHPSSLLLPFIPNSSPTPTTVKEPGQ